LLLSLIHLLRNVKLEYFLDQLRELSHRLVEEGQELVGLQA